MQKSAAVKTDRKNLLFSRNDMETIRKIHGTLRTGKEILQELNSDVHIRLNSYGGSCNAAVRIRSSGPPSTSGIRTHAKK